MNLGIGKAQDYLLVKPEDANELDKRTALDRYYTAQKIKTKKD